MTDTLTYASTLTQLKPVSRGGEAWHLGKCPVHTERTPSFWVLPNGRWKCYGCGATGSDAIWLYIAVNGLSEDSVGYQEAKRALGLWDNARPQPRQKPPPKWPKEYRAASMLDAYAGALASCRAQKDMAILYHGGKWRNHVFLAKCWARSGDPDQYLGDLVRDIYYFGTEPGSEIYAQLLFNGVHDIWEQDGTRKS